MTAAIMTLGLALAVGGVGQGPACEGCAQRQGHHHHQVHQHQGGHGRSGGWILPPGPGDGYGFPNGDPYNAGWYSPAPYLPLGADRTSDYYFPRYYAVPPIQMFPGTDYNPYVNRGQRYLPFAGAGGEHPAGGEPLDSSTSPVQPYTSMDGSKPTSAVPTLRGRVAAPPLPASGGTGLTP
ncbi:hypothetical protein [Paludisphaera mucosa]|uniref:Secreted protein n=1 Tax=Paludisphaera mucosa TaxID=3030827 RepID=A0ABT6F983_9BACT|nr:hypothetical protein [Paludisphaera mucosa]MDG3004149.1 hypothetical protein [Paludisphaera mucosa]